jgi:hypothetical protein
MPRATSRIVELAISVCVAGPVCAGAQQNTLAETPPGARVQLVLRDSLRQGPVLSPRQMVVGQFVRATADSVWIRPHGAAALGITRPFIKTASVSRGTSRWRSALLLGGTWGLCFAAGVAVDQSDEAQEHEGRNVLVGAGVGLGAGVLLGTVRPFEHWRRVRP